jgi:integrase
MGAHEVTQFLTSLAVERHVAASTQNQALGALLFLYKGVLEQDLPWLDDLVRAKRPAHLPVVMTRDEVRAVLQHLQGVPRLMALLFYGSGLRLLEACRLRVHDVDLGANLIVVRDGKGAKDRVTMHRPPSRPNSRATWKPSAVSTKPTCGPGRTGSNCPTLSAASIRTLAASGAGSGSSRRPGGTSTGRLASGGGITCTNPSFSAP